MGIENPVHLAFIAIVALLVLGPKRLPDLARALGKGVREFREAISLGESGEQRAPLPPPVPQPPGPLDPVPPAPPDPVPPGPPTPPDPQPPGPPEPVPPGPPQTPDPAPPLQPPGTPDPTPPFEPPTEPPGTPPSARHGATSTGAAAGEV